MKLKNRRELNLNQEQRERQQFVIYNPLQAIHLQIAKL